jgi:hypothetical protein
VEVSSEVLKVSQRAAACSVPEKCPVNGCGGSAQCGAQGQSKAAASSVSEECPVNGCGGSVQCGAQGRSKAAASSVSGECDVESEIIIYNSNNN